MKQEFSLIQRVAATIRRHRMLEPGDGVLVGVSGGADSVCLVRALRQLGFRVAIAHVNHGWRGAAADEDERFVEGLAGELEVPFFRHRAEGRPAPGNREAAARDIRREFLVRILKESGMSKVALAHSRDDRVETFLLHLLRGSGASGLVSMRPVSGDIIRPLIDTTRDEVEAYLTEIGQAWKNDATNADTGFRRNRLRHVVIPELTARFNPRLGDAVSRTIDILEAEDEWMDREADDWLASRSAADGAALIVEIDDLAVLPAAFARRVLRRSLKRAGSDMLDVGFEHVESIRALLEPGRSGRRVELPGAIDVERNFETLVFTPGGSEPESYEYELPIPGRIHVPEIGTVFEARLASPDGAKPNRDRVLIDGGSLGPYVKIRNWRKGDFYSPAGLPASKLKKLFQRERIPLRHRRQWPVLVAESSVIIWVASFPVSRDFVPTGRSRRIVEFEACRVEGDRG